MASCVITAFVCAVLCCAICFFENSPPNSADAYHVCAGVRNARRNTFRL